MFFTVLQNKTGVFFAVMSVNSAVFSLGKVENN
jgi:hypothetical protein